jgi:methionine aminotransferase
MSYKPVFHSKLPGGETTIFTIMSALATKHNAINLGQGFPNFDTPDKLKDLVSHYLNDSKNQYCPMAGLYDLRQTLADKLSASYHCKLNPETEITILAGATQGLFTTINAFVHPGDEVIIIEPAYDCYKPTIDLVGATAISYDLEGPAFKINWDELARLISSKTRMIIINTPHNPIGKTLKKTDLLALQELTKNTDILVLSDEVYQHLIYDGQEHQSVLRYEDLFKRSLAVFSFGKTFHSTGWKLGYCVGPDYLMDEFRKVHQWNVFCVNSFLQYALADYLKDPSTYEYLPSFYQRKRDLLIDSLSGSRFTPLQSEGTFFQLYGYDQISDEADTVFAKRMTIEHGVAAIPVSPFYSGKKQTGTIRLCFAKTDDLLEEAGRRLSKM